MQALWYQDTAAFAGDVRLVFNNAMRYERGEEEDG